MSCRPDFPIPYHIHIEPSKGWGSLLLKDLWNYRELLFFLTWRDVKVRYKQTILGAGWAILQPLLTMVVFTIFFGRMAKVGSDGLPYPIFSYTGLLPWTFFAHGLSQSGNSLVASSNLLKKVYFPRLTIPISTTMAPAVDFIIAFTILLFMMAWYNIWPNTTIIFFPILILLALTTALGVGMWFSALNVQFRDIKYTIPFFIQIWLFCTPVIYPASRLQPSIEKLGLPAWIIGINPMAGVVEGFRWCLLGTGANILPLVTFSSFIAAALLASGAFYFRRMEKTFADVV